jgi:hypothetical protein
MSAKLGRPAQQKSAMDWRPLQSDEGLLLHQPPPLGRDFCYSFAADRIVLSGKKSRIASSLNGKNPNRS